MENQNLIHMKLPVSCQAMIAPRETGMIVAVKNGMRTAFSQTFKLRTLCLFIFFTHSGSHFGLFSFLRTCSGTPGRAPGLLLERAGAPGLLLE